MKETQQAEPPRKIKRAAYIMLPFDSYLQLCLRLFAEPHDEHPDEEPPRPSKLMPQPEGLWPLGTTLIQTSAMITNPIRGMMYPSIQASFLGVAPLVFVSDSDTYHMVTTVNVQYLSGNTGREVGSKV